MQKDTKPTIKSLDLRNFMQCSRLQNEHTKTSSSLCTMNELVKKEIELKEKPIHFISKKFFNEITSNNSNQGIETAPNENLKDTE